MKKLNVKVLQKNEASALMSGVRKSNAGNDIIVMPIVTPQSNS